MFLFWIRNKMWENVLDGILRKFHLFGFSLREFRYQHFYKLKIQEFCDPFAVSFDYYSE